MQDSWHPVVRSLLLPGPRLATRRPPHGPPRHSPPHRVPPLLPYRDAREPLAVALREGQRLRHRIGALRASGLDLLRRLRRPSSRHPGPCSPLPRRCPWPPLRLRPSLPLLPPPPLPPPLWRQQPSRWLHRREPRRCRSSPAPPSRSTRARVLRGKPSAPLAACTADRARGRHPPRLVAHHPRPRACKSATEPSARVLPLPSFLHEGRMSTRADAFVPNVSGLQSSSVPA